MAPDGTSEDPGRPAVRSAIRAAALGGLLVAAFFVRSRGLSHDLDQGNVYHPDSPKQIYAIQLFLQGEYRLKTGNINYDGYPFFNSRLVELMVRAAMKTGNLVYRHLGVYRPFPAPERKTLFWVTRLLNVCLSTATVWLAFWIARRIFGHRSAILATILTAISPLAVITCHEAMNDTCAIFFAVLAVFFAVRIYDRCHWSDPLFAGLALAFSFSAKYHGGMALFPCLAAHAMRYGSEKKLFSLASLSRLALLATAGTAGLIFANPAFLQEPVVTIGHILTFFRYTSNFGMRPEMKALSLPARWWLGLAHNLPDFYKLLSPPLFMLLIPGTIYELRRRPKTLILLSVPLLYIFVALPFKPLTHPQYHGIAMPLLFIVAAGILVDLWQAPRFKRPARGLALAVMLMAVFWLAALTRETNFYYQCRDTRLIADYWLKDNVPASFQKAAGHYTLTYIPEQVENPRGRVMLSSSFRPHRAPEHPAFTNRFDVKDERFELFRNPVITTYVHDSDWLKGSPRPPVYLSIASPHNRYPILTDSKNLLRTPRILNLEPGAGRRRYLFSETALDEILLVYRNGETPSRLTFDLGADKKEIRADKFSVGCLRFTPRRTVLPAREDRYFYELRAKSENSFAEIRLAFTAEAKGVDLYQAGNLEEALPYLRSAFESTASPTLATMLVHAAAASDRTNIVSETVRTSATVFRETDWDRRSMLENYAIAPDYLESLPYLDLDRSDWRRLESGGLESRIFFLPPGVFRMALSGSPNNVGENGTIEGIDARTGKVLFSGEARGFFKTDPETFALRIAVGRGRDVEGEPVIHIRPAVVQSLEELARITNPAGGARNEGARIF